MGLKEDIKSYDRIIKNLSKVLQTYAWDEESGYFGYVTHDASGDAKAIFRYKDQSNFNKGLDGVTPLAAGICTPEQVDRLVGHLFSPKELWTSSGLSTVDQSAPYYQADGYWNGAVWFPHQWVIWKALLDIGKGEQAYQIAQTCLRQMGTRVPGKLLHFRTLYNFLRKRSWMASIFRSFFSDTKLVCCLL